MERYRQDNIPSIDKSGYIYTSAKIVSATVNRTKNFITINKGKEHGVSQEMGVIGPNGVVGIVFSSSDRYSSVMPIINANTKISVKLSKNNYFGSLTWSGHDVNVANVSEIPGYVDVKVGDLIVTSGYSAIFPEGIPVGKVKSFTKDESTKFYEIIVELFTDFNNLSYVYVIENVNYLEEKKMEVSEDD